MTGQKSGNIQNTVFYSLSIHFCICHKKTGNLILDTFRQIFIFDPSQNMYLYPITLNPLLNQYDQKWTYGLLISSAHVFKYRWTLKILTVVGSRPILTAGCRCKQTIWNMIGCRPMLTVIFVQNLYKQPCRFQTNCIKCNLLKSNGGRSRGYAHLNTIPALDVVCRNLLQEIFGNFKTITISTNQRNRINYCRTCFRLVNAHKSRRNQ